MYEGGAGGDVAQLVRASDRHAADAGSIPQCGKGFFLPESTFSTDSLTCVRTFRVQSHALTSVRTLKSPQSMRVRCTNTPSMHRRLGSATLSQVALPRESNPNFPWEKSYEDNTVV